MKYRKLSFLIVLATLLLCACASPERQPASGIVVEAKLSKDFILMSDGYRLPANSFLPESQVNAVVIALHGFNDYRKAFDGLCGYLVASDIACIAYDQRGFGATEYQGIWPEEGLLESDLSDIVALIEGRYPGVPIYLAGESMGGAVIISSFMSTRLGQNSSVRGAALFAPAVWARETQPWYQRWGLWLAVHIAPSWKPTGESLGIVATDNIEALREMGRDDLVIKETRIDTVYGLTNLMDRALRMSSQLTKPLLIMYGEKDEVIPAEPTCLMLEAMEDTKQNMSFRLYPDGYHMLTRDLQAKTVFRDVQRWILNDGNIDSMNIEQLCKK